MGGTGWSRVPRLIAALYDIVSELEALFPGRKFTPDGHLVGSLGEVYAAYRYDLELLKASYEIHDARTSDGRLVQVKLTGGSGVALSSRPDYLIAFRLSPQRQFEEIHNGRREFPWQAVGKLQKTGQRRISVAKLRKLNHSVPPADRISLRRYGERPFAGSGHAAAG